MLALPTRSGRRFAPGRDGPRRAPARAPRVSAAGLPRLADGTAVRVMVNVADPSDVDRIDIAHCDGVGLMRTEFLFGGTRGLPEEETQYEAYRQVLYWAGDKPVTIRTVDAGGDKPVARADASRKRNPFPRPARHSPVARQAGCLPRADAGAAAGRGARHAQGHVADGFGAGGIRARRRSFAEERRRWRQKASPHAVPPLGIMVEVPAVAITPECFVDAAFFSIGSNDLTQYVMAAARDNASVAARATSAIRRC